MVESQLPESLRHRIARLIEIGEHETPEAVLDAALHLLERQESARLERLEQLRSRIAPALEQVDRGKLGRLKVHDILKAIREYKAQGGSNEPVCSDSERGASRSESDGTPHALGLLRTTQAHEDLVTELARLDAESTVAADRFAKALVERGDALARRDEVGQLCAIPFCRPDPDDDGGGVAVQAPLQVRLVRLWWFVLYITDPAEDGAETDGRPPILLRILREGA